MSKASGVLFFNVVNRGAHGGPAEFHIGGDPGDGFLYKLGQVILWAGWQGDIPLSTDGSDREGIEVPVAKNITGPVWDRFSNVTGNTQPLAGAAARTPATLDTSKAKLISATSETPAGVKSGVVPISASDWAFADCRTVPFPGTPDPGRICLKNGFNPALLYEIVYTAKDPLVLGAGMAAMRDVISFFRYAAKDDAGTANPVSGAVPHTLCMGNSQSGRLEKTFLNLGFNEDENGKMVCDGLNTRIAGMLGGFNVRFAKPGDIAELYDPGGEGPLWWEDYRDQVRGRPVWGILHRCEQTHTCPKITETYGGPGDLVCARDRGNYRHLRKERPSLTGQCPALLSPGNRTRRRPRRLRPRYGIPRSECSRQQPQSRTRDRPRPLRSARRVGREEHPASAERLPAPQ